MWLMCVMGLSFSQVHSQSYWMEHGTLEQWIRAGNRWRLSASEAGTASLVLLPEHFINPTTGCTFRIRWHQGFSGSNANLPRLVEGNQPTVFHWDGGHGENFAALGPYLLKVELHSLLTDRLIYAQAPVFVCPH